MIKIALAAGLFGMTTAAFAEMQGGAPGGGKHGFDHRGSGDNFGPGGRGGGDASVPGRKGSARAPVADGMIGYVPEPVPDMWHIDAPVLGFGNDALWEDMDPAPSTARPARR